MSQFLQTEARIKAIANDLANGSTRAEILGKYGKLWETSRTSIDRYIGKAKILAETIRAKAEKIIEEQTVAVIADAAIQGLRSAIEVDLRVQEIIFNNHKLVRIPDQLDESGKVITKGRVVKVDNTTADVLKAAQLYYRRHNLLGKTDDLTKRKIKITINGKKPPAHDGTAGT